MEQYMFSQRLNRILKGILAAMLTVATLAIVSDSAPQRDAAAQLKLARLMPKGALLYGQTSDLAGQFKLWRASAAHERYFSSKSFDAFQQSRLFLKLQSRTKEFETALGLEFDEDTITALAGGQSAIGIYDLGKLEMVVISEMPRPKAFATVLFANAKSFDEKTTTGGTNYYVREFVADGGRSQQRVAFAYTDGALILASSEALLQRTLENTGTKQSTDRLADEMAPTLAKATGFAAHNVTLWLNQTKLSANHYFNSYWIYGNRDELSRLQTGLIDLQITAGELRERRWFTLGPADQATAQASKSKKAVSARPNPILAGPKDGANGDSLTTLLRFAPAGTQYMESRATDASDQRLTASLAQTLFGQLPEADNSGIRNRGSSSEGSNNSNDNSAGRYRHLDSRYDRDIDDEAAVKLTDTDNERTIANQRFATALSAVIAPAKPTAFAVIETPELPNNQLFVHFNRAVVIELGNATALSPQRLEAAIADEMQARFIVGSTGQRLSWQTEGNLHFLKQALLEQGGAYAISGKNLIIASNKDYCTAVIAGGAATTTYTPSLSGKMQRFAVVRPTAIRPVFTRLTKVLDSNAATTAKNAGGEGEEGGAGEASEESGETADEGPVTFFGKNVKSLLDVTNGMGEATFESAVVGDVMMEVVVYHLA